MDQKDSSHVSPLTPHVNNEDEINLLDYYNVLRKRKWLIIIPTLLSAIIAGAYSFFSPPVWAVNAIMQLSKSSNRVQVVTKINETLYDRAIAAELQLDMGELPTLKAEILNNTSLVRISAKESDIEKTKRVLLSLANHIKRELNQNVEIEIKGIDSKIKSKEVKILEIEEKMKTYKKKLTIVKQREKEIAIAISDISKVLKKEQSSILRKQDRSESESLAMHLYANEIQQSLKHWNILNELLSSKKMQKDDMNFEMNNQEKRIEQLENEIADLGTRKESIEYTQLIQEPTASLLPVEPKKKRTVLIAGILGLMSFTMIAFFIEFIAKQQTSR